MIINGFKNLRKQTRHEILGLLLGALGLSLASFLLKALRFDTFLYNVELTFILVVLIIASQYGLRPGLGTSFLGILALDFFFTVPYNSFAIDSVDGAVAVVSFILAAAITSQIAARSRRKAEEAQQREQETTVLNELNMAVLSEAQATPILEQVVRQIAHSLNATDSALFLEQPATENLSQINPDAIYSSNSAPSPSPFKLEIVQQTFQLKKMGYYPRPGYGYTAYIPLLRKGAILGVMSVQVKDFDATSELDSDTQRWLEIVANQVALAVEHARLIEETAHIASLKEADHLKTTLLASVSHELRTPLTSIKTAVEGLKYEMNEEAETSDQLEYLEVIDQESDRLGRLISNLLDLSRLEAGILKPDKGLYFLPEIVNKTLERLKHNPLLAQHKLLTDFDPNLPLVPVDYLQIDQVLTNLLENALKYSPAASTITVVVKKAPQPAPKLNAAQAATLNAAGMSLNIVGPPGLLVEVIDEGIGIPETELERIFERFYRVSQSSEDGLYQEVSGSGLGLAISKGIVEAHDGQIWAQSRRANGATGTIFAFWLPLHKSTKTEKKAYEQEREQDGS